MKNYITVRDFNKTEIIETQTDQVIARLESHSTAKHMANCLNRGSGFDGWTPAFILEAA